MTGYCLCPESDSSMSRLPLRTGPSTSSYLTPMSSRAFSTRQHGWPASLAQWFEQRCNLTGMKPSFSAEPRPTIRARSTREQRQIRLALAAEELEIDLDAADPSRLGKCDRLRLQLLRGEDPTAGALRRVLANEAEIARQLLDRLDRRDPLDLDGNPLPALVAAHQVDRANIGRPLALHKHQLLAECGRRGGQLFLKIALDAVLLQRRRLAHVVRDVAQHLGEPDLEHVLGLQLAHDEPLAFVLDERRRRHPVQRLVSAGIVMDEDRAVGLEDEKPHRLRKDGAHT